MLYSWNAIVVVFIYIQGGSRNLEKWGQGCIIPKFLSESSVWAQEFHIKRNQAEKIN